MKEKSKIAIPAATEEYASYYRETTKSTANRIEREEFVSRIKGMSYEEMEIVVNLIPIDLCLARISNEINRASQFEASIRAAMSAKEE